ncbi:hypothetical protein TNCV_3721671 [Trichonephila clavipes]|nr:hypothetical protein TNCV_3721671 [Trichonephila clavipes]
MFVFSVVLSVINLFLWTTTQHDIEHFRCSGLSRQRGQVAGRNYPPTNKNTLIRALTEQWDKLPQQLLDNVVQPSNRKSSREVGERGREVGASDPQGVLPLNWGETEPNCSVTCTVLKATANDRRYLALCLNEFRGL